MSAEDVSMLDLQIGQLNLELSKLDPYIIKINGLIKDNVLKKNKLEQIKKTLKAPKIVVSIAEYGNIIKELHGLSVIILNYEKEIFRINQAIETQQKKIKEMELKKNNLIATQTKGTVLEFKQHAKINKRTN